MTPVYKGQSQESPIHFTKSLFCIKIPIPKGHLKISKNTIYYVNHLCIKDTRPKVWNNKLLANLSEKKMSQFLERDKIHCQLTQFDNE